MNVKQLIEELNKFEPNNEVIIFDNDTGYPFRVTNAEITIDENGNEYVALLTNSYGEDEDLIKSFQR